MMEVKGMPFCCTSLVIGMFGEHGEESLVTPKEIKEMLEPWRYPLYEGKEVIDNAKHCIMATAVDPKNIKLLRNYGFKVVDRYQGVQGIVHVMTLHLEPYEMRKERLG
jgi:hypothetical protein